MQSVAVEDSSGLWSNVLAGKMSAGGSQSQDAAAQMIVNKLVADLGFSASGTVQAEPSPAMAQARVPAEKHKAEALVMSKPGHLYAAASAKSRVVSTVASGAILYPTGTAQGLWTQVTDEVGGSGWVSTQLVEEYQP